MKPPVSKIIEDLETVQAMLEFHEEWQSHGMESWTPKDFQLLADVLELTAKQLRRMKAAKRSDGCRGKEQKPRVAANILYRAN